MPETVSAIQTAFATFREGFTAAEAALEQPDLHKAVTEAVATISGIKGRLIVTGLGKSGHIASKLAATFSSTGTPAYFVHPAEASHGDLGPATAPARLPVPRTSRSSCPRCGKPVRTTSRLRPPPCCNWRSAMPSQ
jgi:hypothetical protein